MLFEAVAAGFVGAALLWLVLQPILMPTHQEAPADDPVDPEETPRGQALLALREIEFDRATGKLSEEDFQLLYQRYSARAIALLDRSAGSDAVEELIAEHSRAAGASGKGVQCPMHGRVTELAAAFCPSCGGVLLDDAGHCASCRARIPADAAFCPGCGKRITRVR